MTWLTPRLNRKIDLCKPVQEPTSDGGFVRDYEIVMTMWAEIVPLRALTYIRGVQIDEAITHKFIVRKIAVESMGNATLNELKGNYFIFLRESTVMKGRRFAIKNILNYKEKNEYYEIFVEETEEKGV